MTKHWRGKLLFVNNGSPPNALFAQSLPTPLRPVDEKPDSYYHGSMRLGGFWESTPPEDRETTKSSKDTPCHGGKFWGIYFLIHFSSLFLRLCQQPMC